MIIHEDFTIKKEERYKSSYALKHKTNRSFDTDGEKINKKISRILTQNKNKEVQEPLTSVNIQNIPPREEA